MSSSNKKIVDIGKKSETDMHKRVKEVEKQLRSDEVNDNIKVEMLENMTEGEYDEYLKGNPTRQEVMNFVNGYMNEQILPYLLNVYADRFNRIAGMISVCQSTMIEAGIITADGFKELMDNWNKEYDRKKEEAQRKAKEAQERHNPPNNAVK